MREFSSFLGLLLITSSLNAVALEVDAMILPLSANTLLEARWQCDIRAWVSAPDLEPKMRATGQARLLANGSDCKDIVSWGVGLRFKERAVVRLPNPAIKLPVAPVYNETEEDGWRKVRWQSPTDLGDDWNNVLNFGHENYLGRISSEDESPYNVARRMYDGQMRNESFWIIKSAERIVFETQVQLAFATKDEPVPLRAVRPFGIAMPVSSVGL
jgi:hypothetical protein